MNRAVVIILDGLRRDFLTPEYMPRLAAFAERTSRFPRFRTAFPSATRAVSASFATGCHPARHTLQGNAVALLEDGRLVPHDVGRPDFLQHKRTVTGRALAVPTMAERLRPHGGAVIYNNVSPGAAYAHDPDGHAHVYHRALSLAPGRVPAAEPLRVELDAAGDRAMAVRFIAEALQPGGPALGVLWCGEPDHIQHNAPLGSPEHLAVLREADRTAGMVIDAVAVLRDRGEDVLLIVGSDHGHETVSGVVDVEAELIAAGLKRDAESDDVLAMGNGTSSLIYLHPEHAARAGQLEDFLRTRPWAGTVLAGAELASVGQAPDNALSFVVSLRAEAGRNQFGVPGLSLAALPRWGKPDRMGCGQHGGLGEFENAPVLMIDGPGFAAGKAEKAAHITDLAPTILHHLQVPATGMDGTALQ